MAANAKGISIHIGLNAIDPQHYGSDGALTACEFDARDMEALAQRQGFAQRTVLLTRQATSTAVTAAITDAAAQLVAGDLLLLTYSGHGGQVPDRNGDEPDGMDETWALYDRELLDDELYQLWGTFAAGVRIVVLSDSCHSGSAVRDLLAASRRPPSATPRSLDRAHARAVYDAHRDLYDGIQRDLPQGEHAEVGAHVLLISGCQDNQTSMDGDRNGAFTEALKAVWADGAFRGGYRRLWRAVQHRLPDTQSPNLFLAGVTKAAFVRQQPFTI